MVFTNNPIQSAVVSAHAYDGEPKTSGMLTPEENKEESSPDGRDQADCYYEDSNIRVTADGREPSAIPDDARLLVTPVSGAAYRKEYDTYMEALDQKIRGSVNLKNTLLYDIAVMVPQKDAAGLTAEKMAEYEPESGTVDLCIEFKQNQLTRYLGARSPEDILVCHMFRKGPAGARINASEEAGEIRVKDIAVEKMSGQISLDKKEQVSIRTGGFDVFALTVQKEAEKEPGSSRDPEGSSRPAEDKGETLAPDSEGSSRPAEDKGETLAPDGEGSSRAAEDKSETPAPTGGENTREEEGSTQASEDKGAASADSASMPAFEDSRKIGDITVAVKAEEGVFPKGAEIRVSELSEKEEKEAEAAIEAERPEGTNVAESYSYDIKVLDADGKELQPAEGKSVEVSFKTDKAADRNLDAGIYHISQTEEENKTGKKTKLKAEKLEADPDKESETIRAETDGFSIYTVEFTYKDLCFTLEGDGKVKLSEILKKVGLEGEADSVSVSDETLFSAAKDEGGEWIVSSHKAFSTEEWLKVTIGGVEYVITVTDDGADPFSEYWDAQDMEFVLPSGTYTLTEDFQARGRIFIAKDSEVTIDLGGKTLTGSGQERDYFGGVIYNLGTLTVKNGTITGGKSKYGGGIANTSSGILNVENVAIVNNTATDEGGGIYWYAGSNDDGNSKVTIKSATITDNTAEQKGGGIYCDGTLEMSGEVVIQHNGNTNLYLEKGRLINVSGAFEEGSEIGVTGTDYPCYLTAGLSASGNKGIEMFSLDDATGGVSLVSAGGELYARKTDETVNAWAALQTAINNAQDNTRTVIGLDSDCTASKDQDRIRIPKNKIIEIDLVGHKLNRNRTSSDSDGHVIEVFGKLTIVDSSEKSDGKITGGYAKRGGGINISEDGECLLKSGVITGNKASVDGGGVYVHGTFRMSGGSIEKNEISEDTVDGGAIYVNGGDGAVLEMTGGRISSNYAYEMNTGKKKEYGGDGGGICATLGATVNISNVTFDSNFSRKRGGAIYTTASATISNCTFLHNHPIVNGSTKQEYDTFRHLYYYRFNESYDGGAIYIGDSDTIVNIDHSTFTDNQIPNYALQDEHGSGGAIYLDKGRLNITDSSFKNNKSWEGGAIYVRSGTTVSAKRTTFEGNSVGITNNYSDSEAPQKIPVSSQGGGAISNYGTLTLENCTFTGNKLTNETKDAKGGAIYSENTLTMTGVTCTGNNGRNGGALYLDSGQPNLTSCTIKENSADEKGGGVYVDTGKSFNVKGEMIINDNSASSGNDVYLPSGKLITLTGSIAGSDIGVALENKFGKFSENFSRYHNGDIPIAYFYSCDGYEVILKNNEGWIEKGDIDDTGKFISWKDQIFYNANRLSGPNWMSGLSGERYLNEINMPGTHDSSMKNVSGKGCLSGSIGVWQATTQKEYLFEQLENGARFFDVRMKTRYCAKEIPIGGIGFGVSMGLAFGSSFIPVVGVPLATLFAIAGSALLINESMLPIYKDDGKNLWTCHGRSAAGTFYALDDKGDRLSVAKELEWMKDFLKEHPTETIIIDARPETDESGGKEFYGPLERLVGIMEELSKQKNPATGESYVYWEDGQVGKKFTRWPKLRDCRGKILLFAGKGEPVADTVGGIYKNMDGIKWESGKGTFQDGIDRVWNLRDFIQTQEKLDIPRNAESPKMKWFYWNKLNTTDTMFLRNPVELAENYVLPAMFGSRGLVNETKKGRYFGWFSMDASRANHYRDVWITNFPNDLDYCKVTVKSGLSGSDAPKEQTYMLLRGTTITIPGCIYSGNLADRFEGWNAHLDSSASDDNDKICTMNDTYKIEESVTFTALWGNQTQTPVTVVWKDADNLDGKRPDTLTIGYKKTGDNTDHTSTIYENKGWTHILSGDLNGHPSVINVPNGYTADVQGSKGKDGYTITMTHTPNVSVNARGTVRWEDRDNMDDIRPDSVTLHLYKNGNVIESGTATKAGGWSFDLGTYPRYEDGELVAYKLAEDEIEVDEDSYSSGYSNYVKAVDGEKNAITGFEVTNTHEVTTSVVYARIEWDDDDNAKGARPDSVRVRWMKNGEPFGEPIDVKPGDEGEWVVGLEITNAEMKGIQKKQEAIHAKYQAGEMSDDEFLAAMKGTMSYTIEQDAVDNYTTMITLEEDSQTEDSSTDSYFRILNKYGQNSLTFYKDTAGTEIWQKKMLTAGTSLEQFADYGTAEPNVLEREGYTFAGWATEPGIVVDSYCDKEGTLDPKLEGKLVNWNTNISKDTDVYPIWIRDRLNVEILPGGEDVTINAEQSLQFTVNIDEKIVMRYLLAATRDGYTLDGWYTEDGVLWNGENWKTLNYVTEGWTETAGWGVTPEYCDKDEAGDPVIGINAERKFKYYTVTLTGHWKPKKVTVKYALGDHAVSGAAVPVDSTLTLGNTVTLAAAPDADEAYLFTGWKAPDGKKYSAGGTFLFDNWAAQDDPLADSPTITMTAQYEEKEKVTLSFNANGGTAVAPVTEHVGNSIDLNEDRFKTTRTGYDFEGWYNESNEKCEGTYDFTTKETLTAHWNVKQYTITFDSNGGSDVEPITQDYDTPIIPPQDPTKDHYDFADWIPALPKKMPAANRTVKASWTPKKYTITFNSDGGNEVAAIKDIYGAPVTAPEDPKKDNYVFEGWMDGNDKLVDLPTYMPDTNPTYKAKWHQHKPYGPVQENVKKAACEKKGSYEAVTYCRECRKELSREEKTIPETGHNWGDWTVKEQATETKEGSDIRICKNDPSHTETRITPLLSHEHKLTKIDAVAPTCTEDGNIEYWTCDKGDNPCGRFFADGEGKNEINKEDTIVKATGHDWGEWKTTKKPAAVEEGEKERVCQNDPSHVEKKVIPATGVEGVLLTKMISQGSNELIISWSKVKGVAGYDIFFTKCNKGNKVFRCKNVKTIKGNTICSWIKKKLKKSTTYKAYVKAYVMKDGKKTYVKTSPMVHAISSGTTKKYTNARQVTVKKAAVKLKVGKTCKIKATVKKLKKSKKLLPEAHVAKLRYKSSDVKIATVNRSGKIKAKAKGKCYIYVYAHNGVSKMVAVTVK